MEEAGVIMKPQSLQDAIKKKALGKKDRFAKGEWKEPVVKKHQITAEDMAAEKARGRGGMAASAPGSGGGGGGASAAETMALKNELNMLREEMRNSVKQLKEEQRKAVEAAEAAAKKQAPAPAAAPVVDDSKAKAETEALRKELDSLKSEMTSMRSKLNKAVDSIPDDMNDLREELRQIQQESKSRAASPAPAATNGSNASDGPLVKDVRKTKSEIKELRMMVSQSQDGTTLAKELRVIVDQQEQMLETQTEEVEDLKEQVRLLKRRLETAEFNANEALELAQKKTAAAGQASSGSDSAPSSPVPQVIPMSPTNRKPRKNVTGRNGGTRAVGESSPSSVKSLEEQDGDKQQPKQKLKQAVYDESTGETKLELLHLDSEGEDDVSTDGSDLYPVNNTPKPSDSLLRPRTKQRGGTGDDKNKSSPSRTFSPSSIVLDTDGGYNYKTTTDDSDDSDDSDSDSDSDDDIPVPKKAATKTNASPITNRNKTSKDMNKGLPRVSSFDRDVEDLPGPKASPSPKPARKPVVKDDSSDDNSTTTDSDSDTVPKRKTVSLLPHRSDALYQEQRNDPVLRKFITAGKSPDMSVHKVHGKNLVFFSEKVYIPASLRQQTMEYYAKKHSYNPLLAIQKHCFWPDLEDDMKKFQNKGDSRWRVEVVTKEEVH